MTITELKAWAKDHGFINPVTKPETRIGIPKDPRVKTEEAETGNTENVFLTPLGAIITVISSPEGEIIHLYSDNQAEMLI